MILAVLFLAWIFWRTDSQPVSQWPRDLPVVEPSAQSIVCESDEHTTISFTSTRTQAEILQEISQVFESAAWTQELIRTPDMRVFTKANQVTFVLVQSVSISHAPYATTRVTLLRRKS